MTDPTGLDAAIRQGTHNAERIAGLDAALSSLSAKLGELGTAVDGIKGTIADQAEVLRSVDGLKETVDELLQRFSALFPGDERPRGQVLLTHSHATVLAAERRRTRTGH